MVPTTKWMRKVLLSVPVLVVAVVLVVVVVLVLVVVSYVGWPKLVADASGSYSNLFP